MSDCTHAQGYIVKEGKLVCLKCGEPSPTVKLVNGVFVPIPQPITCSHCKGELRATIRAGKISQVKKAAK